MNEMCDIFIMCFVLFLFVTCFVWNFNAIMVVVVVEEEEEEEEEGGRAEEEEGEVSLGVIMTNTEIKFHILLPDQFILVYLDSRYIYTFAMFKQTARRKINILLL